MYNKDTSVSGARRDVISSLLHYRDFITVIAKQCFVLSVWQDSTRAIRTLFDYHTMAFLSRTGAPDASRLSRKVCENGASPESCFLQRRIVIYIWTRETRTAKSAHINIFYRSCVLCVCALKISLVLSPADAPAEYFISRGVDGRAYSEVRRYLFPVRKLPRALYEIDELRNKYFIYRRGRVLCWLTQWYRGLRAEIYDRLENTYPWVFVR